MEIQSSTSKVRSSYEGFSRIGSQQSETESGADFDVFIRMLTSQIKNQDPLNPMEGTDFAVQLATFSGVEQQAKTNEILLSLMRGESLSGQVNWVGREVAVDAAVNFDGAPVSVKVPEIDHTNDVYLVAMDKDGNETTRDTLPAGSSTFEWRGINTEGQALPNGSYSLNLEVFRNGELVTSSPALVFSKVISVERVNQDFRLILDHGGHTNIDQVQAIS